MELNNSIVIPLNKLINASGGYFEKGRDDCWQRTAIKMEMLTCNTQGEKRRGGDRKGKSYSSARKFFLSVLGG
jgi:hypothetical protein